MNTQNGLRCMAFSVDIGTGHRSAANALFEAVGALRPGSSYKIVEALDYLEVGKLAKDLYFSVLEKFPNLWGKFYRAKGLIDILRPAGDLLDDLRIRKLAPVVRSFRPHVIFAMHPFACGMVGALGRSGVANCPTMAVLTDFDAHPAWIAKGIDYYFVPIEKVRLDMERQGLAAEQMAATGLPLRSVFGNIRTLDRKICAGRIGLNQRVFTILMLGGGLGFGPILETVKKLSTMEKSIRIVLLAARNRELETTAREFARHSPLDIHVHGMVDNIQDFIIASDVAIGKPGGVTCAELLAAGVPLIALSPIPGQEEANCNILVREGAAVHAPTADDAYMTVERILEMPARLREMRRAALRLGRPEAAREIAGIAISMTGI